jgi:hypothetical protein
LGCGKSRLRYVLGETLLKPKARFFKKYLAVAAAYALWRTDLVFHALAAAAYPRGRTLILHEQVLNGRLLPC